MQKMKMQFLGNDVILSSSRVSVSDCIVDWRYKR